MIANTSLPLRHDLVCIRQVTPRVLHLCRVGVTDLVIGASVVGALNHDDVGARAAQLDGVALAGQLPPHHRHGDWRSTEGCREKETECKCDLFWFLPFCFTVVKGFNRARLYRGYNSILVSGFVEKNKPEYSYRKIQEQTRGPAIKRSDIKTYEKRLSTLVQRVWADRTPLAWSGWMSNTTEALEEPGGCGEREREIDTDQT